MWLWWQRKTDRGLDKKKLYFHHKMLDLYHRRVLCFLLQWLSQLNPGQATFLWWSCCSCLTNTKACASQANAPTSSTWAKVDFISRSFSSGGLEKRNISPDEKLMEEHDRYFVLWSHYCLHVCVLACVHTCVCAWVCKQDKPLRSHYCWERYIIN